MTTLLRAPEPSGSWSWDFETRESEGLGHALALAARAAAVLGAHDLLNPHRLGYQWYVRGTGGIGIRTSLALRTPLDDPDLPAKIHATRPVGFPDAEFGLIEVTGDGLWTDADGRRRRAAGLATLGISSDPYATMIEVSVHHDVWSYYAFSGEPHPEIQERNAAVLETALLEIEREFGQTADPGDATDFGAPEGYRIARPEADELGRGPDVTDRIP